MMRRSSYNLYKVNPDLELAMNNQGNEIAKSYRDKQHMGTDLDFNSEKRDTDKNSVHISGLKAKEV